jgi:hypothetical protein
MIKICENGYKLELKNGESKTFANDLELDKYLDEQIRLHPNVVDLSDALTMAVNFQKNTTDVLDEISKKVSSVSRLVTYHNSEDPEDLSSFYAIDGSIGVTRFLQTFTVPSTGDLFSVPFNEDS